MVCSHDPSESRTELPEWVQKQSAAGPVWLQYTGTGSPLNVTARASQLAWAAAISGPLTRWMTLTVLLFQLLYTPTFKPLPRAVPKVCIMPLLVVTVLNDPPVRP